MERDVRTIRKILYVLHGKHLAYSHFEISMYVSCVSMSNHISSYLHDVSTVYGADN